MHELITYTNEARCESVFFKKINILQFAPITACNFKVQYFIAGCVEFKGKR